MSDIFLKFRFLRRSRVCMVISCMAALLFLVPPCKVAAQSDPSNIDVSLFRDINNAQTRFKTSFLEATDNSAYPVFVGAPFHW